MRGQDLILASTVLFASAVTSAPLPSFHDIEKRWIQGETERQIHANHDIRTATPAWPLERDADSLSDAEFAYALDRKTSESRLSRRREMRGLYGALERFFRSAEASSSRRRFDGDEAPVLKPRKVMRYYFS